jgi:hypothetical protein
LIDPGTATYTMDPALRDRFRSTWMHNTVVVDGRSQAEPRGPFHWKSASRAYSTIWRSTIHCDYLEATHDAYLPRRHTRAVIAVHGLGWWILDHLLGAGTVSAEAYWHVHPSWLCRVVDPRSATLQSKEGVVALASNVPLSLVPPGSHPFAMWAPAYGPVEPAPVLIGRLDGPLPFTMATFISARPGAADVIELEQLPLDLPPGPNWHGCAFRARSRDVPMAVPASVESEGLATSDTAAPSHTWGTAELTSDARVALFTEDASRRPEAILVNGVACNARPPHRLVSRPARVPIQRIVSMGVAPAVHEVSLSASRRA